MSDEKREVYIGSGVTVKVDTSSGVGKLLDLDRLNELLREGKEVTYGMSEDWFFTASTIDGDIKDKDLLAYSDWATPVVEINGERQDCYVEVPKKLHRYSFRNGFMSGVGKFNFWVPNFYKRFTKLKYPIVKDFFNEVDELLKKYEDKPTKENR